MQHLYITCTVIIILFYSTLKKFLYLVNADFSDKRSMDMR